MEFLMKSHPYDGRDVKGMWVSEKMDGHRFFWDGGRGATIMGVKCAGFWSNGGKPYGFRADDDEVVKWMKERWDGEPVEGEFWAGRGRFQLVSSVVRKKVIDWDERVKVMVTGPVLWDAFCADRVVKCRNKIVGSIRRSEMGTMVSRYYGSFGEWYAANKDKVVEQRRVNNRGEVDRYMDEVIAGGGEGIMIRSDRLVWMPKRTHVIMKLKGVQDGEATVVGVVPGKGRLVGMIGALIVRDERVFEIGTGLSDHDRAKYDWIGKTIRYRYRELTDAGIPKEARFDSVIE